MPCFFINCVFLYMIQAGIDEIHYYCMDVVGWKQACSFSVVGL
jgi:hypothetical protein